MSLPLLTSCSDSGADAAATAAAPAIKTMKLRHQKVTDIRTWMGYLRGVQDTDLYPRVSGCIIEYKEGQEVKEGDIIYRIDPRPFQAELSRAQANLEAAKAALAQAEASRDQVKLDVDRYTGLVTTGAASDKQLTDAKHNLDAAIAKVKACEADILQQEAAVRTAEINLSYTDVKAPYDGFVGTSLISTGALVSPATKLGNITSSGALRVDFSINSDALLHSFQRYGKVQSDKKDPALANASPAFDIILEDGTTYEHKGEMLSMDSRVDGSGLIDIVGAVPNPDAKLRGGMKINLRVPIAEKDAILVPKEAIRTVMRNSFIIIVDKANIPHSVPVTIDGYYTVEVKEDDGYTSTQEMVAVTDYNLPLADYFRKFGYENITDVPIVADKENGVQAMTISSANSRLDDRKAEMEEAKREQEDSILSSILMAIGLEDPLPSPDSLKPQTITTRPFTYNPAEEQAKMAAAMAKMNKVNPNAKPTMPPVKVKVANIVRRDVGEVMEWYGSLRGKEETEIRPQVSGFLLKQHFRNGTLVKEGDVLFTIDPAPYEAALASAKANLESAKAQHEASVVQLNKAKGDLARFARLNTETPGAVSTKMVTDAQSDVLTAEANVRRALATVGQMEAAVRLAEINLGYTTIKAPFSGRVGISNPSVGALVSPSDAQSLVSISSVDPIRVDFQVSGRDALQITNRVGKNNPNGAMTFDIVLEDGTVYPSKGTIVSPDNVVKKTTGTFGIVAEVENTTSGLRSGMPVKVRAALREQKDALLVPARAPLTQGVMDIILIKGKDNAPSAMPIKKGALVTIEIDGVLQPMQIVHIDPALLKQMGYEDPTEVEVIVEGTLPAGMALQANMAAEGRANKLEATPFIYTTPRTVEPSITADKSPTPNLNKF